MHYRSLGVREVSVLCLGTMFFGTTVDEPTAFRLLDRFTERGGNFVDTANCYCFWHDESDGGDSERLIGRWLAARGMPDDFVLATKVGAMPAGPGKWPANREGLSETAIRKGVERSLDRLGIDRINLLYGHIDDPHTPLRDSAAALASLTDEGLVEQIGMSNQSAARLALAREAAQLTGAPYTALQQRHTYLRPASNADFGYQVPLDEPMLAYALSHPDLALMGFSVLLNGAYTDPAKALPEEYEHTGTSGALAVLREVAVETGATPNQVIYAWMLSGSPAVIPVLGVSNVSQLDEALDSVDLHLTADHLKRLNLAREVR